MRIALLMLPALVALPGAALATRSWEGGRARGLETYTASDEGGSIVVVCDSERAYNPNVNYANFVVRMPKDRQAVQLAFIARGGMQAVFDVRDGVATAQAASPGQWRALVEIIEAGGKIVLVTAHDQFALDMDPMPGFPCN